MGSPTPGPQTTTTHGLSGTGPHSRRWAARERSFICIYSRSPSLALPPELCLLSDQRRPLDSHRSVNSTVSCACEGSRLHAPYENLMPGDLRWSWSGDVSAGERLQMQIIISREVWLHRDHNKSIACRLISKPYQRAASESKLPLILHYGELHNYFLI